MSVPPPIDCTFERLEIVLADGAATPLGSVEENFTLALVEALATGIVIDPDVPLLIFASVTVVGDVVDVEVVVVVDVSGTTEEDPPPHPVSAVARTTPKKTDVKRSNRGFKRAPYGKNTPKPDAEVDGGVWPPLGLLPSE